MDMSRGERWVRRVGSGAMKSPWVVPFSVSVSLLFFFLGLLELFESSRSGPLASDNLIIAMFGLTAGFVFLVIALIWYERMMFYKLIRELESSSAQFENDKEII